MNSILLYLIGLLFSGHLLFISLETILVALRSDDGLIHDEQMRWWNWLAPTVRVFFGKQAPPLIYLLHGIVFAIGGGGGFTLMLMHLLK